MSNMFRGTDAFGWEAEELLGSADAGTAREAHILSRGNGGQAVEREIDWSGAVAPLLRRLFDRELRVATDAQSCVVIEPSGLRPAEREDLLEMLFVDLGMPSVSLMQGAPLALRGSTAGSPTALVVSWGNTLIITPVCHDTVDDTAQRTLPFGGSDVTAFLGRLVEQERGVSLASEDRAALRRLKGTCVPVLCKSTALSG